MILKTCHSERQHAEMEEVVIERQQKKRDKNLDPLRGRGLESVCFESTAAEPPFAHTVERRSRAAAAQMHPVLEPALLTSLGVRLGSCKAQDVRTLHSMFIAAYPGLTGILKAAGEPCRARDHSSLTWSPLWGSELF